MLNASSFQATCSYTPTQIGTPTIIAGYSGDDYRQPSSMTLNLNVAQPTVAVTVGTSPLGLGFSIDGTAYSTAQSQVWNTSSSHTLLTMSPQTLVSTPKTQYVFSRWSDGTTSTTDGVTAPSSPASYVAMFTTQYLLTVSAGPGGTIAASNGYYSTQSVQTIAASPAAGYAFSGWTGSSDVTNTNSPSTTVTMNGPETITANFTPIPVANVSPGSISFGTFYPGGIAAKTVTISNTGSAAMTISDPLIAIVQGGQYFVVVNLCPKSLAPGKSCTMIASFVAGTGTGQEMATLTIKTNVPGVQPTVTLSATVINPQARLSTNSLNFGTVTKGTGSSKTVTLTNPGTTALSINAIGISGDTLDFTVTSTGTPCQSTLNPGNSCTIGVTFKPLSTGSHAATLVITDNAQNSPQKVALSGTGH